MRSRVVVSSLVLVLVLVNLLASVASAASENTGSDSRARLTAGTKPAADTPSYDPLQVRAAKGERVRIIVGVKAAFQPEDYLDARAVDAQRRGIEQAQKVLMAKAATLNARAVEAFENIPFLVMEVDAAGLRALAADSSVTSITEDRIMRPTLAQSVPLIGGPQAYSAGATGLGQTVAVLDTGVAKTHPFLSGKVVSEACYSTNNASEGASSLCPGGVPASTAPGSGVNCTGISGCDHGTHVAGIAAGKSYAGQPGGPFNGVAKDAKLIAVQVFSKITTPSGTFIGSYTSDQIKALQRVYALRSTYKISSVNMSLGGARYSTPALCDKDNAAQKLVIDQLRSVGIATVIASGNESYVDSMAAPGCISSAISVGSTTKSDTISWFSNNTPSLHLLAPGGSGSSSDPAGAINSSVPGGGFAGMSGTSMAAPHVAGAWALMRQKAPAVSVSQVLAALQSTGKAINDTRAGAIGGIKRRIQVNTALSRLTSACNNYEPNGNTASSAREFGVGTSQLHSFCAAGDQDWAKFTVLRGTAQHEIRTFGLASTTDTVLYLYKLNSTTPMASNDNISSTDRSSRLLANLAPGTYLVKAVQKDGAGSAGRTYNLRITRTKFNAAACNLDEPNDTDLTAKAIAVGGTKNYAFCEAPDIDIVKFTAAASTNYRLEANPVAASVDAAIDVYAFNGSEFTYLGTIDAGLAGSPESAVLPAASSSRTIYLVYYAYNMWENPYSATLLYGPSATYTARVSVAP